jgi:hypothetical protein
MALVFHTYVEYLVLLAHFSHIIGLYMFLSYLPRYA